MERKRRKKRKEEKKKKERKKGKERKLNAQKGNDRIGLTKLFLAFLTKVLPTDGPTDGWTHALIEMRGRI